VLHFELNSIMPSSGWLTIRCSPGVCELPKVKCGDCTRQAQEGNSVFLNDDLVAFPDEQQRAHLASIKRIDALTVERIASDASRAGSVVGVRIAEVSNDEDASPWKRLPSGKPLSLRITGPLPNRVSAVLSQRLFVASAGLPSPLLDQIKRIAAFQNPEFYKKQSMRLSTALTPRVISCAEDLPNHVALPRGCTTDLDELLRGLGVALDVVDERVSGEPLMLCFVGALTPIQHQATSALLASDCGVLVAPPGFGKTALARIWWPPVVAASWSWYIVFPLCQREDGSEIPWWTTCQSCNGFRKCSSAHRRGSWPPHVHQASLSETQAPLNIGTTATLLPRTTRS
jgi:hypothetical protein